MKIVYATDIPVDIAAFMAVTFDRHSMQQNVNKRDPFCFILYDDQKTCQGVITGYNHGADFYIRELIVSETLRGQGFGHKLMEAAEKIATARKCTRIWVDTLTYQATNFYEALGYAETTRIPNYRGVHDRVFYSKPI